MIALYRDDFAANADVLPSVEMLFFLTFFLAMLFHTFGRNRGVDRNFVFYFVLLNFMIGYEIWLSASAITLTLGFLVNGLTRTSA